MHMKEKDAIIHNWYGMVVFLNFQTEEWHSDCRTWEASDGENRCLSIKAVSTLKWWWCAERTGNDSEAKGATESEKPKIR